MSRAAYPAFLAEGLCGQTGPGAFFIDPGQSARAGKKVCAKCPVTDACLADALDRDERYGVWGGKTERERAAMKREGK